jgi:hypothetical protein
MTDTLRARIGAVQLAHMPDDYQRDMGECPCGFKYQKWSELASHVADAVIAELGLREEHRERSYGNWPNQPQVIYRKQRRYTSDWKNDE